MGFLIIVIILFVASFLSCRYGLRHSFDGFVIVGGAVSFSVFAVLVTMLCCLAFRPSDFAYAEERYNNLKHQIEYVEKDDIVTGENLRSEVLKMNNEISKHKCYSQSMWVSMWYSERVGSLEPLEWKSGKGKED